MSGTIVRVKGLKRYHEPKTGRWYCYHRATGERIVEEFGTAAFFKRVAVLDRKAAGIADEKAKRGTLKSLIDLYRADERFGDLAPRTKADYDKVFDFLSPIWDEDIKSFTDTEIIIAIDEWKKLRGRRFVNYVITVLRLLFAHAKRKLLIDKDPMTGIESIRKKKNKEPMNRPWTEAERQALWDRTAEERWKHMRLPVALGLFAGLREGDVISLLRTALSGSSVSHQTAKRQVWVDHPSIHPLLREAIEDAREMERARRDRAASRGKPLPLVYELVVNSRGAPWTESGFRASFFRMVRELHAEGKISRGCTFHGLRHTLAHTIAEHEAGYDDADIAAVLGQRTAASARAYTVRANRRRRADAVINTVDPLPGRKG